VHGDKGTVQAAVHNAHAVPFAIFLVHTGGHVSHVSILLTGVSNFNMMAWQRARMAMNHPGQQYQGHGNEGLVGSYALMLAPCTMEGMALTWHFVCFGQAHMWPAGR